MEKIRAVLIFEMLGRPPEHLKDSLVQFIEKISQEDGIEVLNKEIHEPKKLEQSKQELFTAFAETEMDFQNMLSLFKVIFVYMPSHIEIIKPEEIRMKNFELNTLLNELVRKLHQYDEITKSLVIEKNILQKQLQQQGMQPVTTPQLQAEEPEKTSRKKKKKPKKTNRKSKKKK